MAEVCKGCKIMEKRTYWNEFPPTKHSFFKVMYVDFENKLRIPPKFMNCFNGQLLEQCYCSLIGPSGDNWRVKVKNIQDEFFFTKGWAKFVRDHGLKISDFLVFHFVGDSWFKVMIFDASGCERESSYFAKNWSASSLGACASTLHGDENDTSESMFETDEQDSDASSEEPMNGRNQSRRAQNNATDKAKRNVAGTRKDKGKKKKTSCCKEHDMFEDEDGEEEQGEELSHGKTKSIDHPFNLRSRETSKAKQTQLYYISNRRNPTAKEKQRALHMAVDHMTRSKETGRPLVEITMLPTHVYNGFHLTIPVVWAVQHMLREDHEILLQVPGVQKSWMVGCRWSRTQCQIIAKWPRFVLDNNLEMDDQCVFELLQKGESEGKRHSVMNVHIFRAVTQVVPLTESRRVV